MDSSMGIEKVMDYAKQFGLGEATGIELSETVISVPTEEKKIQGLQNSLSNVLYANLSNHLGFMVREDDMNEVPPTQSCIVAVPSNIIGCLQVAEQVDTHFVSFMKFVGVNLQQLPETQILNSKTIDTVMSDVLEAEIKGSSVVNIFSLKIGGDDTYDLRSIVGE